MVSLPRLVIAAPSSGAGKTTVAIGLMAALRASGLRVSGHKIGPDYLDPTYHALATGRPGRNLDPVLCGEEQMGPLLQHGATGADVAVIEGVMGLFDGRGGTTYGSTAHVARLLGAPVVLVVDARAMSASVAALVHGFTTYDPSVRIAGVVLNRVGSDSHEAMLRAALEPLDVPVLGVLRRDDAVALPSRHLGLVPAGERRAEAAAAVDRLGAMVARGVDLDAVLRIARDTGPLEGPAWSPSVVYPVDRPSVVGVVTGPAFGFVYAEHLEMLRATGAEVVEVDQDDEALPDRLTTLYVPGGFPETFATELSANAALRRSVRAFAGSGGAVVAECGGLLWLAESLDGLPMCGVLPVRARMTERLILGYRMPRLRSTSLIGAADDVIRAHEFHYSTVEPAADPATAAWRIGDRLEGFASSTLHASYLHTHWAGAPALACNIGRGHGPKQVAA